jgi:hypothetical protein
MLLILAKFNNHQGKRSGVATPQGGDKIALKDNPQPSFSRVRRVDIVGSISFEFTKSMGI